MRIESRRPKIEQSETRKKPASLILEYLKKHPNGSFQEDNSLKSLVEPEGGICPTFHYGLYKDAHVSRVIDEATSIEEMPNQDEKSACFIAETPFYLYSSEEVTDDLASLTIYQKAVIVISKEDGNLKVFLGGTQQGKITSRSKRIYEHRYVQKIIQSENPKQALEGMEKDVKDRDAMLAYSRKMMGALIRSYNELFLDEQVFMKKFQQLRGEIQDFQHTSLVKEAIQVIPHELRSFASPFANSSISEALEELENRVKEMDSRRFKVHRAIEYFGYKFGSGMNKQEVDKAILIDRCPDKILSKGGRSVGVVKDSSGVYYLFGTQSDYYLEEPGTQNKDRELIARICKEINSEFGLKIAVLDDQEGGSTHTHWIQVGLRISKLPDGEGVIDRINQIIQKQINDADLEAK